MFSTAYWHDPVNCKLCFPNDPVAEIPLIETDSTSTVPAQQIRYQSNRKTESLQEYILQPETHLIKNIIKKYQYTLVLK